VRGKGKTSPHDLGQVKDGREEFDGAYIAVDTNRAVDAALVFSSSAIRWRSDLPGADCVVSGINCRGHYFRIAQLVLSILDVLQSFQQIGTQANMITTWMSMRFSGIVLA
jgi:hypothetical protein